jgi:hypothetical protein
MADLSGSGVPYMSAYRVYVIGQDGHFVSKFVCDTDSDATVWAKQLLDDNDVELWNGYRLVIRLDHKPNKNVTLQSPPLPS